MIGTLIFLGIWLGAIALIAKRREDNRETEDHRVVKRDFYTAFNGELWPRITCSCGWNDRGVPVGMLWAAKLEVKNKMKLHVRTSKKKVDEQW